MKKMIVNNFTLMKEWHPTKNTLDPKSISCGSNKKVWWVCEKGHEWEAKVYSRTVKNIKLGCPYCSNKRVCKDNCLETTHPEFLQEWNYKKNKFGPHTAVAGSGKKVWWICKRGHEWEAKICKRTSGHKCPYCSNQKKTIDNCLETARPDLIKEWHPKNKISISEVTAGSDKKVWWICEKGHEWESYIYSRTKGHGCPYCSGRFVVYENCLLLTHPELSKEWNPKNKIKLVNVCAGSQKKVWWICKNGHEWKSSIKNRTKLFRGCPYCSKIISKPSQRWLDSLGIKLREKTVKCGSKWYIVDGLRGDTVYEFLGDFWHGNPNIYNLDHINPVTKTTFRKLYLKTLDKISTLQKFGFKVVFIWENNWKKLEKK